MMLVAFVVLQIMGMFFIVAGTIRTESTSFGPRVDIAGNLAILVGIVMVIMAAGCAFLHIMDKPISWLL